MLHRTLAVLVLVIANGCCYPSEDAMEWAREDVDFWLAEHGFWEYRDQFEFADGAELLQFTEQQFVDKVGAKVGVRLYHEKEILKERIPKFPWTGEVLHRNKTWGERPLVSVVIAFYDQLEATYACLRALHKNLPDHVDVEIVLVDDRSTKQRMVHSLLNEGISGDAWTYILNPENLGFLKSANTGARSANGEYVVFLNNDVEILPGWLEALLDTFNMPNVGLVCSKLVYPNGVLQEAGGVIFTDGSGWNYGKNDDPSLDKYNYVRDVSYGSGAAIMIKGELLKKVNYFDELFLPAYYEDTDLAFKVREEHLRVLYQPAAVVVHREGLTNGRDVSDSKSIKKYQMTNKQKFVRKWATQLQRSSRPPFTNVEVAKDFVAHDKLHVLVLDYATPRPDSDSGSLRMIHLLSAFRDTGCHVTFRPRLYDYVDYVPWLLKRGIEFIPCDGWDGLLARGSVFDVIVISRREDFQVMHPVVREHFPAAYFVYDTVDLHFLREQRMAELMHTPPDTSMKELELGLMKQADLTLVVSAYELGLLERDYPDSKYDLLSNIHTETPSTVGYEARRPALQLLFVGNFHHTPNVDAMEWYVDNVHQLVREMLPSYELLIVGQPLSNFEASSWLPERLQRMEAQGVRALGHVPDMASMFDEVLMTIAPLRYGAGVKGKVSESLAYGVPVVTTSIGSEGMFLTHGEHCLVGNMSNPLHFAQQIAELADNKDLWERLRKNGLQVVKEKFSSHAAAATVAKILKSAAEHKKKVAKPPSGTVDAFMLRRSAGTPQGPVVYLIFVIVLQGGIWYNWRTIKRVLRGGRSRS